MSKIPITYYGGKKQLLPKLLNAMPNDSKYYCEPFAGGLALYFSRSPVEFEVINDTNNLVINFYEILRLHFDALKAKIEATLFSRTSYKVALDIYTMPHLFNKLQQAWAFYFLTQAGYACQIGSFGVDTKGKRVITFNNKKLQFNPSIAKRLEKTLIENRDAITVIKSFDCPEMFIYADPPYVSDGSTPKINQGHYKNYTLKDYKTLLDTLAKAKGKFLLSSYPSELLDDYIKKHGWHTKTFDKPLSAQKVKNGEKRKRKTEVLTANYPI